MVTTYLMVIMLQNCMYCTENGVKLKCLHREEKKNKPEIEV